MGIHALDQNAAENVSPIVIVGYEDPRLCRFCRKRGPVAFSIADRRQEIDAGVTRKCFGNGQSLGSRERIDRFAAMDELHRAGGACRLGQQTGAVIHQRFIGLVRPIPLEHRKFGMMKGTTLAVAEDTGKLDDTGLARRQ